VIRLVIGLLVLGLVLNAVWPQSARNQTAAAIARSYCAHNPQAEACGRDGHAYDVLKPYVGLDATTPTPSPGAGR
jgi:hypothetical protein